MKIGYIRVSTTHQKNSLAHQEEVLTKTGCEKLFSDEESAVKERQGFLQCLDFVRDGDVLVVTALSRFCRSIKDFVHYQDKLTQKNVSLIILDMNMDTSTPTGRLLLNLMASVYQFEREMNLERQKVGLERSRKLGRIGGRKPITKSKIDRLTEMLNKGVKYIDISRELNISIASVYNYRKKQRNKQNEI